MDERYHTSVTYGAGQYPYQHGVVYRIEEAFKVKGHAVFIPLGDIFLRPFQCLVATPVRAEAEAVVTELAFIDGNQYLADGLLDYPVHHRRDTKRTFLAIILRYFYTEDGIRALSARFQGFHEFIFVFLQIVTQCLG